MNILRRIGRNRQISRSNSYSSSQSPPDSPISMGSTYSIRSPRKSVEFKSWIDNKELTPASPKCLQALVMNFLHMSGLKNAAEAFAEESGIQALHDTTGLTMQKIKSHLEVADVTEIKNILDSLDCDILGTDLQLSLDLKIFKLRMTRFEKYSDFAAAVRENLFLMFQEIENLNLSRIVDSPYSPEREGQQERNDQSAQNHNSNGNNRAENEPTILGGISDPHELINEENQNNDHSTLLSKSENRENSSNSNQNAEFEKSKNFLFCFQSTKLDSQIKKYN